MLDTRSTYGEAITEFHLRKLIKDGIALSSLRSAVIKSCDHLVEESFRGQVTRLEEAGYPDVTIGRLCERLACKHKKEMLIPAKKTGLTDQRKFAVIPYVHCSPHRLKKVRAKYDVNVVFSAGRKFGTICQAVQRLRKSGDRQNDNACTINHHVPFVACQRSTVYKIPLSCGNNYIDQTGRCLNERLIEHKRCLKHVRPSSNLSFHCKEHKCKAILEDSQATFLQKNHC